MASKPKRSYLDSLQSVNDISTLIDALSGLSGGLSAFPPESLPFLESGFPSGDIRLDKLFSNIRVAIPPETARQMAELDRIRARLCGAFRKAGDDASVTRANRLNTCNDAYMIAQHVEEPRSVLVPYTCHQRYCPACARAASMKTWCRLHGYHSLFPQRVRQWNLKWITLTIVNPAYGNLRTSLLSMLKAFKNLKRPQNSTLFKSYIKGYLWNAEVSINLRARTWHPHIHLLVDAEYVPWTVLKHAWQTALSAQGLQGDAKVGEAYVLEQGKKIPLRNPTPAQAAKALLEVTKYVFKPFEIDRTPTTCVVELAEALHDQRLHGSDRTGTLSAPPPQKTVDYAILGGLGKMLGNYESPYWTDTEFQRELTNAMFTAHGALPVLARRYTHARYLIQGSFGPESVAEQSPSNTRPCRQPEQSPQLKPEHRPDASGRPKTRVRAKSTRASRQLERARNDLIGLPVSHAQSPRH
jgi:hypothetical protein